MSYDPNEFYRPDGSLKTSAERQSFRDARDRAQAHAKREAAEARPKEDIGPYAKWIAELQQQKKFGTPAQKQAAQKRLNMVLPKQAEWEDEQNQKQMQADFDKSDYAALALSSAEFIGRNGAALYPNSTPEQRAEIAAMVSVRFEYGEPGQWAREIFGRIRVLEDQEAAAAKKSADSARLESERLQAEAARADLAAATAAQRKAQLPDV